MFRSLYWLMPVCLMLCIVGGISLAMSASPNNNPHFVHGLHGQSDRLAADAQLLTTGKPVGLRAVDEPLLQTKASSGLPLTWCGTKVNHDLPGTPSALHFKMVYGLPRGAKSRLNILAPHMQADAVAISQLWARETGGVKTIRWDMGSSCGPQYLDIITVRLPHTAREYRDGTADNPATDLTDAVAPMFGPRGASASCESPANNALMYIDGSTERNNFGGIGYGSTSDTKPTDNSNDCGGGTAIIDVGVDSDPASPWLLPNTAGHEILHAMGAIGEGAPRATEYGHCTDEHDLLCYDDGSKQRAKLVCRNNPGLGPIAEGLDCGHNDYFARPGQARGKWLQTHWNLYNSAALVPCSEAPAACSGRPAKKTAPDTEIYREDP